MLASTTNKRTRAPRRPQGSDPARPLLRAVAVLAFCLAATAQARPAAPASDIARWQREAQAVTITRDDWGIAHVHGRTDADAVFGMAYAQAEDDFNRVETNYLVALGRLAEARDAGDRALWQDLRQRLFIDPVALQRLYAQSPGWLRAL
ncbi:MAG: penicillin acylase family protein, partial [Xanthomonadaceae bacterium]|nr:penicillin acylase family protein [Xanthomonadaceae bacterium]